MAASALFWLLFLVAAGAGARSQTITQYNLGAGDRLSVTVFGQPDMSGEFEVDATGSLTLPLMGAVSAAGLTVTELTEKVTAILDRDYLVDPQVSIEVLNFRPFYILGEVKSPGSYAYVAGVNIRQAIAIAGGFTKRARSSSVQVFRDTRDGQESFDTTLDASVLPGDTIQVERRLF